jgi:hypothetical protein
MSPNASAQNGRRFGGIVTVSFFFFFGNSKKSEIKGKPDVEHAAKAYVFETALQL